ncbi:MAG TPA: D-alanine--poly(phosphoribitol) ligase subunit DltA [Candidatus Pullilachnospira stercoravium]|uniref:D-alanine--poly(Phosphoribitol) ligase subunit DltA n=1 Tax=Candidatus Pullilachnospira stercoravium TaxID=2840913 RepID=A0A9D1T792_9FIRM|nr:D-alanine--poly(phosphoribitol) ligase subunit DltA [Candidatus Pullilachnospira stercoravium]
MNILKQIKDCAKTTPKRIAFRNQNQVLTYEELWTASDRLAAALETACGGNRQPVAVYGHKETFMLVCFLACVKSGRAYCPIDRSVPDIRTEAILKCLDSPVVLTPGKLTAKTDKEIWDAGRLARLAGGGTRQEEGDAEESCAVGSGERIPQKTAVSGIQPVSGGDTFYIIFTSGSTGTPKGVKITADCLNHFLEWSVGLGGPAEEKQGAVFLNQAPFSFDLSVMDLYTCLACGGTLWCLEKEVQEDYQKLMDSLKDSGAGVWVSTPSFAELCLADPGFEERLLPRLRAFLFCGETLPCATVRRLKSRFPQAVVVNTYGPTESTVAVTEVEITDTMAAGSSPLPVGRARPGTRIEIRNEKGAALPEGEQGEIVILGDTVSTGYLGREDLTAKAFFVSGKQGEQIRGYRTGDAGYLQDGMLYYAGRMDLQVKLHGYRIELEDIESNLRKLPGVSHAVVIPRERGGKIRSLTAFVSREQNSMEGENGEQGHEDGAVLRRQLMEFLPSYMIPKKIVVLPRMPLTNNGKADRKALGGMVR